MKKLFLLIVVFILSISFIFGQDIKKNQDEAFELTRNHSYIDWEKNNIIIKSYAKPKKNEELNEIMYKNTYSVLKYFFEKMIFNGIVKEGIPNDLDFGEIERIGYGKNLENFYYYIYKCNLYATDGTVIKYLQMLRENEANSFQEKEILLNNGKIMTVYESFLLKVNIKDRTENLKPNTIYKYEKPKYDPNKKITNIVFNTGNFNFVKTANPRIRLESTGDIIWSLGMLKEIPTKSVVDYIENDKDNKVGDNPLVITATNVCGLYGNTEICISDDDAALLFETMNILINTQEAKLNELLYKNSYEYALQSKFFYAINNKDNKEKHNNPISFLYSLFVPNNGPY